MNRETELDDATLMAYADGELDATARAAIETAAEVNPGVAARIAEHVALRQRLQAAFDRTLEEPLPAEWEKMIRRAAPVRPEKVVSLETRRKAVKSLSGHRPWKQWGALAASVAIAAVGAQLFFTSPQLVGSSAEGLVARGSLATALSTQLAATQKENAAVQLGISFRNRAGEFCRTFRVANGAVLSGLACRRDADWHVEMLMEGKKPADNGENYRLAATAIPPAIRSAVEAAIDGEPLDADQESAARNAGWR